MDTASSGHPSRSLFWLAFAAASTVTLLLYWPGLRGPYLIDDTQHLALVEAWLRGQLPLKDVIFANGNWLTNRSLAMGSLALSAWLGGYDPLSFKLGNLIFHLLCALVAFILLRGLLARDEKFGARAQSVALLITAVWLLHPLNVSTVLYSVQRMAQVATLFCLLGVWLYASVRTRMLDGRIDPKRALAILCIGIPLLTLLGIQGKQNAVVLPGLCLVVELAWFQVPRSWNRGLGLFYLLLLVLPGIIALAGVVWNWRLIQTSVLSWDMTMGERLLSQPRVLWEYMHMLVVPYSPSMGLFFDDFPVSRSLFHPWTTLPAIAGLVLMSVMAWRVRSSSPSIFAGWFWFLVAHSVEASVLPIELYYEHRNYLPAFGLLLMVAGLINALSQRVTLLDIRVNRIGAVLVTGILLVLIAQTFSRVQVWKHGLSIGMAAVESHPNSVRAHLAYANASIDLGRLDDVYATFQQLSKVEDPQAGAIGKFELIALDCMVKNDADPQLLREAVDQMPDRLNMVTPYVIAYLVGAREKRGCGRISATMLGDAIAEIADKATTQPDSSEAKWPVRYNAALAYYQGGQWSQALKQARLGWQQYADPGIALLLVELMLHEGQVEDAEVVFQDVMKRGGYKTLQEIEAGGPRAEGLRKMRAMIDRHPVGRDAESSHGGASAAGPQ